VTDHRRRFTALHARDTQLFCVAVLKLLLDACKSHLCFLKPEPTIIFILLSTLPPPQLLHTSAKLAAAIPPPPNCSCLQHRMILSHLLSHSCCLAQPKLIAPAVLLNGWPERRHDSLRRGQSTTEPLKPFLLSITIPHAMVMLASSFFFHLYRFPASSASSPLRRGRHGRWQACCTALAAPFSL
jgi:hypothetical protein